MDDQTSASNAANPTQGGTAHDPVANQTTGGSTQGDDQAAKTAKQELDEFLNSTPPPEPRGSAYKHTDPFQMFSTTVNMAAHSTTFDEKYFLYLFSGSLSLSLEEKRDILGKIPNLSQFQIDQLILILEEEKQKFDELEQKHPEQVQKLRLTARKEWEIIEMDTQKQSASQESEAQAEEIRKQLGL